jgi:hypothetical protein
LSNQLGANIAHEPDIVQAVYLRIIFEFASAREMATTAKPTDRNFDFHNGKSISADAVKNKPVNMISAVFRGLAVFFGREKDGGK